MSRGGYSETNLRYSRSTRRKNRVHRVIGFQLLLYQPVNESLVNTLVRFPLRPDASTISSSSSKNYSGRAARRCRTIVSLCIARDRKTERTAFFHPTGMRPEALQAMMDGTPARTGIY